MNYQFSPEESRAVESVLGKAGRLKQARDRKEGVENKRAESKRTKNERARNEGRGWNYYLLVMGHSPTRWSQGGESEKARLRGESAGEKSMFEE